MNDQPGSTLEKLEDLLRNRLVRLAAGGLTVMVENIGALYGLALAAGITLAPGPMFSARQRYRDCIRLNASFWSPAVEAGIARLGELTAPAST